MVYCSSAADARDSVKIAIQKLLREASVVGDTVVLTGSDGIMMKTWLVDLFADKTNSINCKIIVVIGTSAINCGISSPALYYIFMKGFPRNICELIQLMGRLKRGSGERIKQDRIHLILSLPYFVSVYYSILSLSNQSEMNRQLKELENVSNVVMCRNKCILQNIEEYYGAVVPDPPLTCDKLCPSCRGESIKVVKRDVLIDKMESDIFDQGSVTLGTLATKILNSKGSIWVAKATEVKAADAHVLTIMMWIHRIINIHWSSASINKDTNKKDNLKTKKDLHCSFRKKPIGAAIRMYHRDDTCWLQIPHV